MTEIELKRNQIKYDKRATNSSNRAYSLPRQISCQKLVRNDTRAANSLWCILSEIEPFREDPKFKSEGTLLSWLHNLTPPLSSGCQSHYTLDHKAPANVWGGSVDEDSLYGYTVNQGRFILASLPYSLVCNSFNLPPLPVRGGWGCKTKFQPQKGARYFASYMPNEFSMF